MGENRNPLAVLSAIVCGRGVDDRVDQAAGGVRHHRRAVALAVHLVQPAGLEARWHQEDVGAGLDLVRHALVVADVNRDLARVGARELLKAFLQARIARTQDRELGGHAHQRSRALQHQIEALLIREAADQPDQRDRLVDGEPEPVLQRALVLQLHRQARGVVVLARCRDRSPGPTRRCRCR